MDNATPHKTNDGHRGWVSELTVENVEKVFSPLVSSLANPHLPKGKVAIIREKVRESKIWKKARTSRAAISKVS